MPQYIRRTTLVAALAATTLSAYAQDGDIAAGPSFAREACSACHVLEAEQQRTPKRIFIGPGFRYIANRPGMPTPIVTPEQMADVIAYILSLRSKP